MVKQPKTAWTCGPGGLKCACCRRGSQATAKVGHRRALRRVARQALRTAGEE